jgi:hypothetical protein
MRPPTLRSSFQPIQKVELTPFSSRSVTFFGGGEDVTTPPPRSKGAGQEWRFDRGRTLAGVKTRTAFLIMGSHQISLSAIFLGRFCRLNARGVKKTAAFHEHSGESISGCLAQSCVRTYRISWLARIQLRTERLQRSQFEEGVRRKAFENNRMNGSLSSDPPERLLTLPLAHAITAKPA